MMNIRDVPRLRLYNQRVSKTEFTSAEQVVSWLGAVQAQDYAGAKWALGQRLERATDDLIEQALTEGKILRTHMMRPTWHFVAPLDIRWIQKLTAPRVRVANAFMDRKLGLDEATFRQSNAAITKALRGKQLTRAELASALEKAGIHTENGQRLAYLVMRAELDGIICSGARRCKQFTYALVEERVPHTKDKTLEEALADLTRRYFTSHGPATVRDFSWWSGLTLAQVRRGIDMLRSELKAETIGGQDFWSSREGISDAGWGHAAYLLPNYDEYGIAYKDHSPIFGAQSWSDLRFPHLLVIKGRLSGTWKRTLQKASVLIEYNAFDPLTRAGECAVAEAAERYGQFLGLRATLEKSSTK